MLGINCIKLLFGYYFFFFEYFS